MPSSILPMWLQAVLPAISGGLLIGLSISILFAATGRIAGISGIFGRLAFAAKKDRMWRSLFLGGLLLGGWLAMHFNLGPIPLTQARLPTWLLLLAGLLVGYGTAMANGCTSGHGVCGVARLSIRSIVATGVFLTTGILTTYVARHILHWI